MSKIDPLTNKTDGLISLSSPGDIQEKFRSSIFCFPQIIEVSKRMIQAAKLLDVPIIITEQYPKGKRWSV